MNRKATIADFNFVYDMYMHPIINPHLLYEQMDKVGFKPIFEKLVADGVLYIFEDNNEAVGMFKLVPLTYRSAHVAYLGGFAVSTACNGKGLGTKMLIAVIELAKQKGIKRIELSTGVQNKKAIDLYKRCGFEEEGILRKLTELKNENRYIDEIMMSYIIE
jgi:L-phenylalanine/L-methionine N-acetyltransferase